MFVFTKVGSDSEKFVLLPTKSIYTVGRLNTDLVLKEDLSISRVHVRLHLPSAENDPLRIEDLGSKYGTFINDNIGKNKKMEPNSTAQLRVGDKVRFGALTNVWEVTHLTLITATSALTTAEVQKLGQLIQPLGGRILPTWTDQCSHLTMNEVSVTVKLLHALLEQKPIVSFAFWQELVKAAGRKHVRDGWPQPEAFLPQHSADVDVKWRPERCKLFAGKTFVFVNRKHFDTYGSVVQKASGACKDLNTGVRKTFLTKRDVVVIQYVSSTQSQATETINNIADILDQANLRIIPEYEIGMAILTCSIEKYCNPSYKFADDLLPVTESMATTESLSSNLSIIVPNTEVTQRTATTAGRATEVTVPESEVYKPETHSEEPVKKQQPNSQSLLRKRNHAIYLDSSDDDDNAQLNKKSKSAADKPKTAQSKKAVAEVGVNKKKPITHSISLDSSEDDDNIIQLNKKPTFSARDKAAQSKKLFEVNAEVEVNKKKAAAAASPSRTLRGKRQATEEDDNVELFQFNKKKPNKEASTAKASTNDNGEEQEDEDLFQFNRKATTSPRRSLRTPLKSAENNAQANGKPAAKPLTQVKLNQVGKISVRNFLEKSQMLPAADKANEVNAEAALQPRKRLRIEVLNESDCDDDDNLFDFGDNKKAKKTRAQADSDDEGLFNFTSAARQEQGDLRDDDQDSVATQPFVAATKCKSKYIVPQPKQLPRKVNVSGWLSCSGHGDEVKSELNVSHDQPKPEASSIKQEIEEEHIDENDEAKRAKWLESIKDAIQVRMCNLSVSARSLDHTDGDASKYSGRKNFKKFVKKSNLHPHQRVLELKRLQLAEGEVTPF